LEIRNKHAGDLLGKQMGGKTNTSEANNTFDLEKIDLKCFLFD